MHGANRGTLRRAVLAAHACGLGRALGLRTGRFEFVRGKRHSLDYRNKRVREMNMAPPAWPTDPQERDTGCC